jgi:hypothetical protein
MVAPMTAPNPILRLDTWQNGSRRRILKADIHTSVRSGHRRVRARRSTARRFDDGSVFTR